MSVKNHELRQTEQAVSRSNLQLGTCRR